MDWGHWVNNTDIPDEEIKLDDYSSFIYRLVFEDGRTYIGRKAFWSRRRLPPLKGRKRHRIVWKESDWRGYQGSSEAVNRKLMCGGVGIKHREILAILSSKSATNLAETLAISLSRLCCPKTRPINIRIEGVGGGYSATEQDTRQLKRLVKMILEEENCVD